MRSLRHIAFAVVAGSGASAHAQQPEPEPPPAPAPTPEPTPPPTATPTPAPSVTATQQPLSDEDLVKLSEGETIEIYAERPSKPFDRDTTVRLTGEELAKRGAVDLGTALSLLSDVAVRDGGRGGFNIDVRGARKGAVSIFIDGVLVSDPYYGTFDVSTIPITDIVQIRVSTTPQSPIDGPGGPGGVIEVHTRDAIGPRLVVARLTSDTLPTFGMSGTARTALAKHLAARFAATGLAGARDMELPMGSVGEDRQAATGSARGEYRDGDRRVALDLFLDTRHYLSPPSDDPSATTAILLVDRETSKRASIVADDKYGTLQVQGQGWVDALYRRSRNFSDPNLTMQFAKEDLNATRIGGRALVTAPVGKELRWALAANFDHESATVVNTGTNEGTETITEFAADGQFEHGPVRVDLAGGVAVPIGIGADPWPEGKLSVKYRPQQDFELTATTGYKGRVPALRERYDSANGNPALGPEFARHAEVRAIWEGLRTKALARADEDPMPRLHLEVAPYARKTTGTSRVCASQAQCPGEEVGKLQALDATFFYGIDTQARVKIVRAVEVGGSYDYIKACELDSPMGCDVSSLMMGGADPLDRLPRHRADGWVSVTPHPRVAALARVRYIGSSIDKSVETEAYTLVEANVSGQLGKSYLAVLRVDDALDRRPETRNGFHAPGRVVTLVLQGTWE